MPVDALNAADWVIITVVGISTLISLLRGFIKEALSLIGWVLAFVISMVFAERFAALLGASIEDPTGRYVVAFAGLFVLTLIAVGLLGRLLRSLVEFAGLGALDRVLGMAFGFVRGVFVLLVAVVMMRGLLQLDGFAWWQESLLLPHILVMEGWFRQIGGSLAGMMPATAA
jgi:membrane protein required for colicin V production